MILNVHLITFILLLYLQTHNNSLEKVITTGLLTTEVY